MIRERCRKLKSKEKKKKKKSVSENTASKEDLKENREMEAYVTAIF